MLHKVMQVLEFIANSAESDSINTISRGTGISRSSVHRILTSLREEDIITFIPPRGYILTPKLFSISLKGLAQKDILNTAIPVMRAVAEKTRESVSLNVLCGYERVCVYNVQGSYPVSANIQIGDKGPLVRGAAGRIIALSLSENELENVVAKAVAEGIIDHDEGPVFLKKLEETRVNGYAISSEERFHGRASIGVPLKDPTGNIHASLTISSLVERMTEENVNKYLQILNEGASQISSLEQGSIEF